MKIKILIFTLFCFNIALSQDQLFKKDNAKLEVKILEITPTEVKYKLFSNADGPLYIISKSEVALIIYKNGEHEAFKTSETVPVQVPVYVSPPYVSSGIDSFFIKKEMQKVKHYEEVTKPKNVLFINSVELLNVSLGFDYLHEFLHNTIDVHVPLSFSIGDPTINFNGIFGSYNTYGVSNYKLNRKAYDVGLGIYVNTSGKRAITHFIGPLFRMAQFNGSYQINVWQPNSSYYSSYIAENHNFTLNQTYAMLNNGFLYRLTPHFNIMMNIAVGIVTSRNYISGDPAKAIIPNSNGYYPSTSSTNTPAAQFGFCFGYRF